MFLSVILIFAEFSIALADNPNNSLNPQLAEAENLRKNGKYQQAIDLNLIMLRQDNSAQNKLLLATCYKELGILYWNIGELSTSKDNFVHALIIAEELGISTISIFSSISIQIYNAYIEGKKYRSERETAKAISSFLIAIDAAKRINSIAHQLKCERQLSLVYFDLGQYAEYYQLNRSALELARQTKNAREISNCLNNIGVYFLKLEDYARARIRSCNRAPARNPVSHS